MRKTGGNEVVDWIADAAVVGLWEVLKNYGYFKTQFAKTLQQIADFEPDVVVLVDYPGFNLRLARALRESDFQGKIAYYISPQVWAWNRRRIPTMAKQLDLMICIFPFEEALYQESGLPTVFPGHPLVDELNEVPKADRESDLLGLFPGSREREVRKLFPTMLATYRRLRENHPSLRAEAAAANERLAESMRALCRSEGVEDQVMITTGKAHQLMQRATVGVVASGTATLEAAWFGLPYCLVYRVAWPTYVIGRALVKVDYLGIVNILADREVVREFIQGDATPEKIASTLSRLLGSEEQRAALQDTLRDVASQLGEPGTHRRAAEALVPLFVPTATDSPPRP